MDRLAIQNANGSAAGASDLAHALCDECHRVAEFLATLPYLTLRLDNSLQSA